MNKCDYTEHRWVISDEREREEKRSTPKTPDMNKLTARSIQVI